jgi:peptide/nickel transport system substrate-binding protein
MTTRRVLIFAPTIIVLILLQSYFWVPTYDQQTRGNPERLHEYIAASIGDASILNPTLSADSASSDINSMVFEGLIDRDENLHFRGRLATSWKVNEEAYFCVNESADIPGLGKAGAEEIANLIRGAQKKRNVSEPGLKASLDLIEEISIVPPKEFTVKRRVRDPKNEKRETEVKIRIKAPQKIKLTLSRVDQDLFRELSKLLGSNYFAFFKGEKFLSTEPEVDKKNLAAYAGELLPATEHNPVLVFQLRPNVRFHDGHVFDASDVRFTFEAIMNPKNLSPRIADYEPVKAVEVIDPLTVRIIYKRLYSPAIGTWGMGILPEHLLNDQALKAEAVRLGKDPNAFSMRHSSFNRSPVGCGPFVFRAWKSDQYINLERFDD